ncbi:MAG: hypothetical protein ACI90A_000710, partial [Shewanella sp.]
YRLIFEVKRGVANNPPYAIELFITFNSNRRDKQSGVNAAVTFRDKDVTAEPTWIVLAACHRCVYTLGEPQAID